jgi:hypothetical protein
VFGPALGFLALIAGATRSIGDAPSSTGPQHDTKRNGSKDAYDAVA